MGFGSAAVLQDEVHFLDAFAPDEAVVLPELRHGDVFLIHAGLLVNVGADTAVAVVLAFVRNVADTPHGRLTAGGFLQNFEADMHGPIAVVHGDGPVFGALRVELVAFDVVVRRVRFGVIGVRFGERKGHVKEDELVGAADGGARQNHKD